MADLLLGAEERAPQVHRQHPVEGGGVEPVGRLGDLDAGVVDQEVDRTELVGDGLPHLFDLVLVRHVGLHQPRSGAGRADLVDAAFDAALDGVPGRLRPFGPADVVDGDVHPFLPQADGDRLADPRAATGDDGRLALQSLHDPSLPSFGTGGPS